MFEENRKKELLEILDGKVKKLISCLDELDLPPEYQNGVDKIVDLINAKKADKNPVLALTASVSLTIYLTLLMAQFKILMADDQIVREKYSKLMMDFVKAVENVSEEYRMLIKE